MASPQLENGYTRIANEILEAISKINLTAYQARFIHAVWRKLYGYGHTEDWISNSQLVTITNLQKSHVSRTKKELLERHIIVTPLGNKIKFNKDYSQWRELPNTVKVTNPGQKLPIQATKVTSLGAHKRKKETYTKETVQQFPLEQKNRYEALCDLCEQYSLQNAVSPKLYFAAVDQFSKSFIPWPEVQACAFWCKEKGFKFLNASRIRNWFMRKKKWDKEKELKEFSKEKDKRGKDVTRQPNYKPPVDIDLTHPEYV